MANEPMPTVTALITCLGVTGNVRATLHEVFLSLSGVPELCYVYLEFIYAEPFSYCIRLIPARGNLEYESEEVLVLSGLSGRGSDVVPLALRDSGLLPGAYTLVVESGADGGRLSERDVFFGEM